MKTKSAWDKSVKVEVNRYYWKEKGVKIYKRKRKLPKKGLKVVELFSGCGGTSLGFEMAGYHVILGADIHSPSVETFHDNHKYAHALLGDLCKITGRELKDILKGDGRIDVMIAGVPCQGFSLNNRKRHANDERNFLFMEFIRFVRAIKPRAVIMENVSGLRSTKNGRFVRAIQKAIGKAGYSFTDNRMLNAADYGVPQRRERLFFIGLKNGDKFKWPIPTHGDSSAKFNRKFVTIRGSIGDLPYLKSGEVKTKYSRKPSGEYQRLMRKGSKELFNHKAPKHPRSTIEKISSTKRGEPMYKRFKQRIRLDWSKLSPTQVSGGIRPQFQFGHSRDARGLTVRERCRIQSFPDTFKIYGGIVQGRVQTGNAVPPLLAKALAEKLKESLIQ